MAKRVFDVVSSLLGLMALIPVFIVLCLLIRRDGGPAFFLGVRVGLCGKPFRIYKFRSMVVDADRLGAQVTASHDPRITGIGAVLRRTKLDELPQLFNVFIGHMSIVGPRPEVPSYVYKWSEEDRRIVLSLKPGITDYATLFYHDEQAVLAKADNPETVYFDVVMPHKLEMYRRYVRERNFGLDLKLVVATLGRIVGLGVLSTDLAG
jgi:lipopolysaccharide/colanic/teichoic acid biosynthesis glycosyltransferase